MRSDLFKNHGGAAAVLVAIAFCSSLVHALPPRDAPVYDSGNAGASDFAKNENHKGRSPEFDNSPLGRGDNAFYSAIKNAGSGNFLLRIPVISLPGRGLDLNLVLTYNAHIWDAGPDATVYFDADRGWPAPGWTLGFGKLTKTLGSVILVESDGTRRFCPLDNSSGDPCKTSQTPNPGGGTTYSGRTMDGSFVKYSATTGPNGLLQSGRSVRTNGTIAEYSIAGSRGENSLYPTRITDRNGNFISVRYRNDRGPQIESITDTLGRVVTFTYDAQDQLLEILRPLGGNAIAAARFKYGNAELRDQTYPYQMTNPDRPFPSEYWRVYYEEKHYQDIAFLEGVFLQGNNGYWFGDTDSYAISGVIKKVSKRRNSSWNPGGVVAQGLMTRELEYDYPGTMKQGLETPPASQSSPRKTVRIFEEPRSVPRYTTATERWDGMTTPPAVTKYEIPSFGPGNPKPPAGQSIASKITRPDDSVEVQMAINASGAFSDGMPEWKFEYDANGNRIRTTASAWEPGVTGSPRLVRSDVFDEALQRRAVWYVYAQLDDRIAETIEFDDNGTSVLRRTRRDFVSTTENQERNLIGFTKLEEIFDGNATSPVARTEFYYDEEPLASNPGALQRDPAFDKLTSGTYLPQIRARGNATRTVRYADMASTSGAAVERRRYDVSGNLVQVIGSPCCDEIIYTYSSATKFAYPEATTRGASGASSPNRVASSVQYDLDTGLPRSILDENGNRSEIDYYTDLRIQEIKQYSSGSSTVESRTNNSYDDSAMSSTETTSVLEMTNPAQYVTASSTTTTLNGRGLVRKVEMLINGGQKDIIETEYDNLGRVARQSRPFRSGDTLKWTQQTYDALGRVRKTIAPDGSVLEVLYGDAMRPPSASALPGTTMRSVDPWGREMWSRRDSLGRVVEAVEPNPKGSGSVFDAGSVTTRYSYTALDQLARAERLGQVNSWVYDGLGRLTAQSLAERQRTLNHSGQFVAPPLPGTYSDVYLYDLNGRLSHQIDARGVDTQYVYDNSGLNRIDRIEYYVPSVVDSSSPIRSTSGVKFTYRQSGNLTQIKSRKTADFEEAFGYDSRGRVSSRTLTWADRPQFPVRFDYTFDPLGRLREFLYPPEYGTKGGGSASRATQRIEFDEASRPNKITLDGDPFAWNIGYNSASQITTLSTNSLLYNFDPVTSTFNPATSVAPIVESYDYYADSGLLSGLKVANGTGPLLDLSYDYQRAPNGVAPGVAGQITRITDRIDPARTRAFNYDAVGRLVKVNIGMPTGRLPAPGSPAGRSHVYDYDDFGNRTTSRAFPFLVATACPIGQPCLPPTELSPAQRDGSDGLTFDQSTNRIASAGYVYDAAGNLIRSMAPDGSWQKYRYDAAGRLVAVTDDGGTQLEGYVYDAQGRRVVSRSRRSRLASPDAAFYAWDGSRVVSEFAGFDSVSPMRDDLLFYRTKTYVYFGNRLIASLKPDPRPNSVEYSHPDHLGTRLVIEASGQVTERVDLNAFGTELGGANPGQTKRRFTTYDRSAVSGLDYAVNRFYDPRQGRFVQVDPLGRNAMRVDDPQSFNLYTYVNNDPINRADPEGLKERLDPTACGALPGDTWGLGGCRSALPPVGLDAFGYVPASGDPRDFELILPGSPLWGTPVPPIPVGDDGSPTDGGVLTIGIRISMLRDPEPECLSTSAVMKICNDYADDVKTKLTAGLTAMGGIAFAKGLTGALPAIGFAGAVVHWAWFNFRVVGPAIDWAYSSPLNPLVYFGWKKRQSIGEDIWDVAETSNPVLSANRRLPYSYSK